MRSILVPLAVVALLSGCATPPRSNNTGWPRFTLHAAQTIVLNPPNGEEFDASALLFLPDGALLTVNDRGPRVYRIEMSPGAPEARLVHVEELFRSSELAAFAVLKHGRYDCEGLARDERGRIYMCEEADRWILRCDPKTGRVERLPIDW